MAEVIMRARISGTRDGVDWPAPGEVLSTSAAEAAELIDAGLAVAKPGKAAPESAAAPEPETAAALKPTRRARK
jgi:hypothetical protein